MGDRWALQQSKKGRKKRAKDKFSYLPFDVLTSEAFITLSNSAKWALIAFCAQYRDHNNGNLVFSRSYFREFGITSHGSIDRARKNLLERKLIIKTAQGSMHPKRSSRFATGWGDIYFRHYKELDYPEKTDSKYLYWN